MRVKRRSKNRSEYRLAAELAVAEAVLAASVADPEDLRDLPAARPADLVAGRAVGLLSIRLRLVRPLLGLLSIRLRLVRPLLGLHPIAIHLRKKKTKRP